MGKLACHPDKEQMFIKKMIHVVVVVLSLGLGLPLVSATPAEAAGSTFNYTFTGVCCINSRQFDTTSEADVYISVRNMSPCDSMSGTYGGDGRPDIKMQLFQSDAFSDTKIGGDKYIIDCAGTVKWSMVNARDNLYVKMTLLYPHRDSKTYSWSGTVAYNGATLTGAA